MNILLRVKSISFEMRAILTLHYCIILTRVFFVIVIWDLFEWLDVSLRFSWLRRSQWMFNSPHKNPVLSFWYFFALPLVLKTDSFLTCPTSTVFSVFISQVHLLLFFICEWIVQHWLSYTWILYWFIKQHADSASKNRSDVCL